MTREINRWCVLATVHLSLCLTGISADQRSVAQYTDTVGAHECGVDEVGTDGVGADGVIADESTADEQPQGELFATDNLVAWCIVPFDARQRGPAERARMLQRLGLKKVAYDWRSQHVPTFEEEILQYKRHGLEYFAFWSWHDSMEPLIRRHGIRPQIWRMLAQPQAVSQPERVAEAAAALLPLVQTTRRLNCPLGIYNHGGWSGEPQNMVAVVKYLREKHDARHVGIVYNFHHGHEHIAGFESLLQQMRPYLLCVNINGMMDPAEAAAGQKIVPVGAGKHEAKMLRQLQRSGYRGPIGILDHRSELDAEQSLRQNLQGLESLRTK